MDSINDLFFAGDWDQNQQAQYNEERPEIIESCVHQLIGEQARLRPGALAIHAWDGQLTYKQLDETANRLAHHLAKTHAVRPDDFVLVCFEKSVWFYVSILAINKAGAAWVPLEASHPPQRRKQVIDQTGATLALTSATTAPL